MSALADTRAVVAERLIVCLNVAGYVLLISSIVGSVIAVLAAASGLTFERLLFVLAALGLLAFAIRPQTNPDLSRFVGHGLTLEDLESIKYICSLRAKGVGSETSSHHLHTDDYGTKFGRKMDANQQDGARG
jgi:hypothetical protein